MQQMQRKANKNSPSKQSIGSFPVGSTGNDFLMFHNFYLG